MKKKKKKTESDSKQKIKHTIETLRFQNLQDVSILFSSFDSSFERIKNKAFDSIATKPLNVVCFNSFFPLSL